MKPCGAMLFRAMACVELVQGCIDRGDYARARIEVERAQRELVAARGALRGRRRRKEVT
jgi:hypothetical protein